jgi:protein TonB
MTEAMNGFGTDGGMEFGALLQAVLRDRREAATAPAGLEQRLKARLAQAAETERVTARPFTFAESVKTQRSGVSMWTAMAAHAVVLLVLFGLASRQVGVTARKRVAMLDVSVSPPPTVPSARLAGGGGGAHDVAPATQGRLPKFAKEQIVPPMAPPTIAPRLAVEPTVVVQKDLKMAESTLPNLGLPNAPAASIGSLGTGGGEGVGGGNGNGVGPGSGGNMGGGVYSIGAGVRAPKVLVQVDPEFSEEARKQKFSGNVLVRLIVDEQGNPSHVRVLRGVGLGLDEKAVEAVRQYKFRPATKDGKPVKVELSVDVRFEIF